MAPRIPSEEPTAVAAGDTWQWTHQSSAYPVSDGWGLSYLIRGPSALLWLPNFISEAGGTWTVTIAAAYTKDLLAGRYDFARRYTGSGAYQGHIYTETLPPLVVAPNLNEATAGQRVTHAETMLSLIEAALQSLVTFGNKEYTIGQRSFTRHDLNELYGLRRRYRAEVWQLRNPGGTGPQYAVAFSGIR